MYLVTFDVTGIQRYVFGSNRVADNIGASALVDRAMRAWTVEAAQALALSPPGALEEDGGLADFSAPGSARGAAFIRRTGGGAQLVVREETAARELVGRLTRRVAEEAAGMQVVASITPWPTGVSFWQAGDAAQQALADRKGRKIASRHPDLPGVVERCQVTAEPAAFEDGGERISLDVAQRRSATKEAGKGGRHELWELADRASSRSRDALRRALHRSARLGLEFVGDLDLIRGRKGATSYVAVVHVDANGMGRAFRRRARGGERAVASAALEVDLATGAALATAVEWISDRVEFKDGRPWVGDGQVELHRVRDGRWALPFRPIVGAGDDLTFVCEGTIAIPLAKHLTVAYRDALREIDGFAETGACAGVGLGLAHAPFWQLYRLAEEGCRIGKRAAQSRSHTDESYLAYRFYGEHSAPRTQAVDAFRLGAGSVPGELDDWDWFVEHCLAPCQKYVGEHHAQLKGLLGDLIAAEGSERARIARWKQRGLLIADLFEDLFRRFGTEPGSWPHDPRHNALELMDFVYREEGL